MITPGRALNDNARDASLAKTLPQLGTELDVLVQQTRIIVSVGEPTRIPRAIDTEP
jgi:hypothetical protein